MYCTSCWRLFHKLCNHGYHRNWNSQLCGLRNHPGGGLGCLRPKRPNQTLVRSLLLVLAGFGLRQPRLTPEVIISILTQFECIWLKWILSYWNKKMHCMLSMWNIGTLKIRRAFLQNVTSLDSRQLLLYWSFICIYDTTDIMLLYRITPGTGWNE